MLKRLLIVAFVLMLVFPFIDSWFLSPSGGNRKRREMATVMNLRTAVLSYSDEYGKLPLPAGLPTTGLVDFVTDDAFMDILLGADTPAGRAGNPRGIVFFNSRPARPGENGSFRNGVNLNEKGGGSLWDSWGRLYGVRMGLRGKNQIPNPGVDPPVFAERPIFPKWGKPQLRVSPRMIVSA